MLHRLGQVHLPGPLQLRLLPVLPVLEAAAFPGELADPEEKGCEEEKEVVRRRDGGHGRGTTYSPCGTSPPARSPTP